MSDVQGGDTVACKKYFAKYWFWLSYYMQLFFSKLSLDLPSHPYKNIENNFYYLGFT